MRLISILASFLLFGGLIAAAVFFKEDIAAFSEQYLIQQKAEKWVSMGHPAKAIEVYEKGLAVYPQDIGFLRSLAFLQVQTGHWSKAERLFDKFLKRQPQDWEARLAYANTLSRQKKFNPAILQLRRVYKKRPQDIQLLNELGHVYRLAAEHLKGESLKTRTNLNQWSEYYYQHALLQETDQYYTRFNLGVVQQRLNKPEKAVLQYCEALLLEPDRFQARYNLGLSLIDLGNYEEGFRQLDGAVATLMGDDEMAAAQQLAEAVQGVKNTVHFQIQDERRGLVPQEQSFPEGFQQDCLTR